MSLRERETIADQARNVFTGDRHLNVHNDVMSTTICHIHANHDAETGQWWAESDDLAGLVSEAPTFDALVERVKQVAGELAALNGIAPGKLELNFMTEVPVQVEVA